MFGGLSFYATTGLCNPCDSGIAMFQHLLVNGLVFLYYWGIVFTLFYLVFGLRRMAQMPKAKCEVSER
jgi:hypothetical protein